MDGDVRDSVSISNNSNFVVMFENLKYWFRLIVGGVTLPIVFPWLVYHLYKTHFKNRVHRSQSLHDKVVLITGASSGLGEALAHAFFKAGCKVILSARRKDALEKVKEDLIAKQKPTSHEPRILQLDLSELQDIGAKAKEAINIHGRIDILINNGGISYRGEAQNTNIDVDLKVMVVNYFGTVALTKAILPSMIKNGGGNIVAVSSVQGKFAIPFRSAYAASKHAVQAFFDTLRAEVAESNIHVCVVSPGYIQTNLSLNAVTGDGSKYGVMDSTTAGGMDPQLVAEKVLYAVMERKNEVMVSNLMPKVASLIRVLWPGLYFHLMNNRAHRLRKQNLLDEKKN